MLLTNFVLASVLLAVGVTAAPVVETRDVNADDNFKHGFEHKGEHFDHENKHRHEGEHKKHFNVYARDDQTDEDYYKPHNSYDNHRNSYNSYGHKQNSYDHHESHNPYGSHNNYGGHKSYGHYKRDVEADQTVDDFYNNNRYGHQSYQPHRQSYQQHHSYQPHNSYGGYNNHHGYQNKHYRRDVETTDNYYQPSYNSHGHSGYGHSQSYGGHGHVQSYGEHGHNNNYGGHGNHGSKHYYARDDGKDELDFHQSFNEDEDLKIVEEKPFHDGVRKFDEKPFRGDKEFEGKKNYARDDGKDEFDFHHSENEDTDLKIEKHEPSFDRKHKDGFKKHERPEKQYYARDDADAENDEFYGKQFGHENKHFEHKDKHFDGHHKEDHKKEHFYVREA